MYFAKVVSIFKKGETDTAANYRPISLLSSLYRVYVILIRERIQSHIDKLVTDIQFSFRPAKSTAHAIFIVRRLQDF